MPRLRLASLSLGLPFVLTIVLCHAAELPRRARPPRWSQDVLDAFFDDAREQLVGRRPPRASEAEGKQLTAKPTSGLAESSDAALKWSALIDGETLLAEIKRINNQLGTALNNSASFQGGGNLLCRRDFSLLTVLFGILVEFDDEVRWQSSAKLMQQSCFQASQYCLTASAQSYGAAQETHALLGELIRGQSPAGETSDGQADQQRLVDRTQLMQSMELVLKEGLSPALANAREFRRRYQLVSEQAQLLAALAEVIQQTGYEYSDDDTYLDEARQLRSAARELAKAAVEKNYETARTAAGRVSQSCSRCHEDYRG